MAFVVGGFRFPEQSFQPRAAQLNSSLLTLSVIALIIPSAFHTFLGSTFSNEVEGAMLLSLSRGSSIVMILIYFAYVRFCVIFSYLKNLTDFVII